MAVLVIKVEDASTLRMNEFFDYDGWCYGLTRSRMQSGEECINLEDFYECTVQSEKMTGVPVIFAEEIAGKFYAAGWYRKAEVRRNIVRPSLFLEGNVRAEAKDVCLLPEGERKYLLNSQFAQKCYEVIEEDDSRYQPLMNQIENYSGKNDFLRYDFVDISLDSSVRKDYEICAAHCMMLAERMMSDNCSDIREIKELEVCAQQAVILAGKEADGYYYLAMACHQLGKVRKGMKAIEKALKLEPQASDLMAMKANLLLSLGYAEAAAELYHQAWLSEADEDYLLLEGKAWLFKGQMDRAIECFKKISNREMLLEAGINLKDMERKWPFIHVRGFNLKNLFNKS